MESPAPEHSIADAIAAYLDKRSDGAELLKLFRTHVERRTRNYPPVYFGGERDSDAVASIANEVFVTCTTPLSWSPFDGRTPFDLFVSERHNDGSVLWLLFQGQFSVLRDVMRRQPARWGGPDEQHRRQVAKVLNGILSRTCTRLDGPTERWSAEHVPGPPPAEREALVPWLVGRFGPLTRRDILQLTLAWEGRGEIEENVHESSHQLDVREIVVDVWRSLDALDRALVVSVARGDPYSEVLGWFPARDSVALSRRLTAVNRRFTDALGLPEAAVPPKEVAERLGAVLAALPVSVTGLPKEAWNSGSALPMMLDPRYGKEGERTTKTRPFGVPPRLQRLSDADAVSHCLRILERVLTRGFLGSLHAAGVRRRGPPVLEDVPVDPPDGPAGALGDPERFVICDDRWLYAVPMPSGVSVLLDARRPLKLWGSTLPFGAWMHMEGRNIEDVRATVAELRG